MSGLRDLTGQHLGRLLIVGRAESRRKPSGGMRAYWKCRCACGVELEVAANNLLEKRKPTRSCGCLQDKGHRAHPLYRRWVQMIQRCENPNAKDYANYGGRGIKVCERWRNDFMAFVSDLGPAPLYLTIDRVNVNGHYEPTNCRWATRAEQMKNRRVSQRRAA